VAQSEKRHDADLLQPTVFLAADLIALEAAFLLTFYIRFLTGWLATPLGVPPFEQYLSTSFILLIIWAGIFYAQGLYDPTRRKRLEEDLDGLFRAVALGSMVILALAFFVRKISYSRTFFFIFFFNSLFFLAFGRLVARSVFKRYLKRGKGVVRVLFVGATAMRGQLLRTFDRLPELGLRAVGQVIDNPDSDSISGATEDGSTDDSGQHLPVLGPLQQIEAIVGEHSIDLVLLTLPFRQLWLVTEVAERLGDQVVDVQFVPDMKKLRSTRMRLREIAGMPFISVRNRGLTGMDRIIKRAFDIVVSALALIGISPILLLLALAVKLTSRGPVLYRQARLGRGHRSFGMLKFRTMRVDAEESSGPVWTQENDPRRTVIGSFLRRFSLDELPQFWNVLRGDMSLVGPRPEREVFVREFQQEIPRYLERHRVRSGLTGWAQVHGLRGNTPIEVRTLYDLYYVENWSVTLDLQILLRTFVHVLRGDNAY
jgi:exopolysaccharide biosynthesis polyprenyl glycosylphosphotransferase